MADLRLGGSLGKQIGVVAAVTAFTGGSGLIPTAAAGAQPTRSGYVSACEKSFKTVETAAEAYKAQVGGYPGTALPNSDTATAGSAPKGVTPDPQILDLMGAVTSYQTTSGPWLQSYPYVPRVFQIRLTPATGRVYVAKTRGNRTIPRVSTYSMRNCESLR